MKSLFALSLPLVLAACAGSGGTAAPPSGNVFTLWSPAFKDGATLEQRHAGNLAGNPNCVGQNVSPPLAWSNVPAGTRSLAILVHDQAGRNGLGVAHWVAYDIPVTVSGFAENEVSAPSAKYTGGKSTLNLGSYMGPCPPASTGLHPYVFTLIATDIEPGSLPAGLTLQDLTERLNGHAKAASSMVLRYGRP
ncbi:MAG: YbhB/YbcL family Raf kinase inhibitor-like protein [Variovorax sp.]|nr:YbhB/YbcL family Raf kinase inhibitor-like protein [Variovorax sp.]